MSTPATNDFPSDQDWIENLIAESESLDDPSYDEPEPADDERWGCLAPCKGDGPIFEFKRGCDKYNLVIDPKTRKLILVTGNDGKNFCLALEEGKGSDPWEFYVHITLKKKRTSYPIFNKQLVPVGTHQFVFHDTINPKHPPEGAFIKYDNVPLCQTFRGGFGSVRKVFLRRDRKLEFAMKIIRQVRVLGGAARMRTYEISALKALNHPNICRLEEAFTTRDRTLHLIMEYADHGMLGDHLICKAGFAATASPLCSEVFAGTLMLQLCSAMDHIHSLGIIHRDIKPENILLASKSPLVLKVADFGLATRDVDPARVCGSYFYMAPEVLKLKGYDTRADIYSVGALFLNILLLMYDDRVNLFKDWRENIRGHATLNDVLDLATIRTDLLETCEGLLKTSKEALELAKGFLRVETSERTPSMQVALENIWLNDMNTRHSTPNSFHLDPTEIVNHNPNNTGSNLESKSDPTPSPAPVRSEGPSSPPRREASQQNAIKCRSNLPHSALGLPLPETTEVKGKEVVIEPQMPRRSPRLARKRNAPY